MISSIMAKITYIEPDGTRVELEADDGNLMELAIGNGVDGVSSSCGGMASCAACLIKIPQKWQAKLEEKEEDEVDALEFMDGVGPDSRLACQIEISDAIDGIEVIAAGE